MTVTGPTASTLFPATFRKRLFDAVLPANLAIVILLAFSLRQSQIQQQERAAISTRNLALVLEKQLLGMIEKVALALLSVADPTGHQLAQGGMDGNESNDCLARVRARPPELDGMADSRRAGRAPSKSCCEQGANAHPARIHRPGHRRRGYARLLHLCKPRLYPTFGLMAPSRNCSASRRTNCVAHPDGRAFPAEECKISNSFKDGIGVQLDDAIFWQ